MLKTLSSSEMLNAASVQLAELETPSAALIALSGMAPADTVYPVTFLDLPPGYGIDVSGLAKDSITVRMLELMKIEQWRGQPFNDEMQMDHDASTMLMLMLVKHQGYGSIVAGMSVSDRFDRSKLALGDGSFPPVETLEQLQVSLETFFDTLVAVGWENGNGVFFGRPGASTAERLSVTPFEMHVSSCLVGWRLPDRLVDSLYASAEQRDIQSRRNHERPAA